MPEAICAARPTTDTYSLSQSQDEFYFALPYEQMDLALWAKEHGYPAAALAEAIGLTVEQAGHVLRYIDVKRETTRSLHAPAQLVFPLERS